jgi:hypothetical protein
MGKRRWRQMRIASVEKFWAACSWRPLIPFQERQWLANYSASCL